jgi:exopolyphosphatase/guanosine-5'-triphosphate,3'-diphosphate pyrophosphatase
MMRVAIIDLGSNTARLVTLAYEPHQSFHLLDELRQVVRLSEGMQGTNIIQPDAFERGIGALVSFRSYCDAAGITNIQATATSAVRDAVNGDAFLRAARKRARLELRILSGEEEAYYGTLAVANSLPVDDALVLDIGGGSAQLSLMRNREFMRGQSWPLGAVRLTERFLQSDPPKKKEVRALTKHVTQAIGTFETSGRSLPLVGMGGTIRNLADMYHKQQSYPLDLLHGYFLSKAALEATLQDLLGKTLSQRRDIPGLNSDRADIIIAGALVANAFLEHTGAPGILISGQGLREGLFYPYLLPDLQPPLLPDVRAFSVQNLTKRYYDNPAHNEHVRKLALELFDQLTPLHGYGPFERDLLSAASRLHDIGMAINYYDHHKHGFYLAVSETLPGFTHREHIIIALLIRYHRKGKPDTAPLAMLLEPDDHGRVMKLAALVRLAEYLERSKAQLVKGVRCHLSDSLLRIEAIADARTDAHICVEVQETRRRTDLLEQAYGIRVEIATA